MKRRIDWLETTGVVQGYTVRVDQAKLGAELQAVVQLTVVGDMDLSTTLDFASRIPEVEGV